MEAPGLMRESWVMQCCFWAGVSPVRFQWMKAQFSLVIMVPPTIVLSLECTVDTVALMGRAVFYSIVLYCVVRRGLRAVLCCARVPLCLKLWCC